MNKKYYAVRVGKKPGVYTAWGDCLQAVQGVSNAVYKSFNSYDKAVKFANGNPEPTFKDAKNYQQDDFEVVVHTDGGCRNHGNVKGGHVLKSDPAAWACLIQDKLNNKNYSSTNGKFGFTNNYMEVRAVMRSLQFIIRLGLNNKRILFICDSKYALNASNIEWLKNKAKKNFNMANGDMWKRIYGLLNKYYTDNITWAWTHGHEGEKGNEYVDHLLNRTMDKLERQKKNKNPH